MTIVSASVWNRMADGDKKIFEALFREAAVKATGEIIESEKRLMTDFSKHGKTVLQVDRKPFMAAVQKFYASGKQPDGSSMPWQKDVYDRLQTIK